MNRIDTVQSPGDKCQDGDRKRRHVTQRKTIRIASAGYKNYTVKGSSENSLIVLV